MKRIIDYVRQQNIAMQQQVGLAQVEIRKYILDNQSELVIDWIEALSERQIPEEIDTIVMRRFPLISVSAETQMEEFLFNTLLNELKEIKNSSTPHLPLNK